MTPKEKGQELVNGFFDKMFALRNYHNYEEVFNIAKECALITLDEMLQLCDIPYLINYYEEVKEEIDKL